MAGPPIPSWPGAPCPVMTGPPYPVMAGPLSRHGRPSIPSWSAPYLVMAGLDPAIRSGTSLRQMGDCVTDRDEWVAINERWYNLVILRGPHGLFLLTVPARAWLGGHVRAEIPGLTRASVPATPSGTRGK